MGSRIETCYDRGSSMLTFTLGLDCEAGAVALNGLGKVVPVSTVGLRSHTIGVLLEGNTAGSIGAVQIGGAVKIVANGVITAGVNRYVSADTTSPTRVVAFAPATVGDFSSVLGIALTSATAAGQEVLVKLVTL